MPLDQGKDGRFRLRLLGCRLGWSLDGFLWGFAHDRRYEGETAVGNRHASHAIPLDGVWRPGEDFGDRDIAWTRRFFAALGRFRQGVYVNFLGGDEDPDRVREAYGDSVYSRLVDVKSVYDPDNVFRHNQNIRPRALADLTQSD